MNAKNLQVATVVITVGGYMTLLAMALALLTNHQQAAEKLSVGGFFLLLSAAVITIVCAPRR